MAAASAMSDFAGHSDSAACTKSAGRASPPPITPVVEPDFPEPTGPPEASQRRGLVPRIDRILHRAPEATDRDPRHISVRRPDRPQLDSPRKAGDLDMALASGSPRRLPALLIAGVLLLPGLLCAQAGVAPLFPDEEFVTTDLVPPPAPPAGSALLDAEDFAPLPAAPGSNPNGEIFATAPTSDDLTAQMQTLQKRIDQLEADKKKSADGDKKKETPAAKPATSEFPSFKATGFLQLDSAIYSQDDLNQATVGDAQDGTGFRRACAALG